MPLLDHLITEMETRFSSFHQKALKCMSLVPSILVTLSGTELKNRVKDLVEIYRDDLPSPDSLASELHCWAVRWQKQQSCTLPSSPSSALQHAITLFPNIRMLLTILCTLPVTTYSTERSFSALKSIKTNIRSAIGTARLSILSLLHIHRDISVEVSDIIDIFARRNPRKMELVDVIADAQE
ncbi:52 kDa repressor of the inhibitor of the protein kinase-like [Homarus americanus]|uniref:52 kDa repressor of the inhibitor of the protein kinase-like n=1 Tax=Homarus americanus TaxID=6706 RepID=UPI001C47C018|nr:52 kDa repressor of the inhibitor of the protein kinase-like [Homarus americanus]